ncbi:MAG TPA: DUF1835 domain-containing protein [Ktedonobacterales bacterium]
MLHITNGDSTGETLRAAELPGAVLPWRDMLHEGPVPAGLALAELSAVRARFIASTGWPEAEVLATFQRRDATLARCAAHEEVVLWFEHDLYDQLQLLQLLDWFAGQDPRGTRLSLICVGAFPGHPHFHGLGELTSAELVTLFPTRQMISAAELALGQAAWQAFRAPDPTALAALVAGETAALPFLRAALRRCLEEFPAPGSGLSRTERQLLEVLTTGVETPHAVFQAWQAHEEAPFMGDTPLWMHLRRLGQGAHPLIALAAGPDGESFRLPHECASAAAFAAQRLRLTDAGRAVLAGEADQLVLNGGDRWLGGVHLRTPGPIWRWDGAQQRLLREG